MSIEFLYCLKRERHISINSMFSGGKTTFRLSPPLRAYERLNNWRFFLPLACKIEGDIACLPFTRVIVWFTVRANGKQKPQKGIQNEIWSVLFTRIYLEGLELS